ncbi:MAG: 5-oxoprolinase subunit PxpB [Bacteroidota bacterium]|nr:5-oxoprolinase subunit PxpB [Bacteroidota bacterium]
MDIPAFPYHIFPLGDSALTVDYGNCIDEAINREVIARFIQLRQEPLHGMIEVVPAYSSFTVYYDVFSVKKKAGSDRTAFDWMQEKVKERLAQTPDYEEETERIIHIPVCYEDEFAPDLRYLAAEKNITVDSVIQIHTSKPYKVYMLGFLPGFTYMGEVDDRIKMPRKPQPVSIAAGSVGIAGRQTGIYPLASPGGWQIIGSTPAVLFDVQKELPALLRAGDRVQFYSITSNEFYKIQNSSLPGENLGVEL